MFNLDVKSLLSTDEAVNIVKEWLPRDYKIADRCTPNCNLFECTLK